MASIVYDQALKRLLSAGFDLTSAAMKVALTTGYTPNRATDQYWSDASATEVTGTGYTAGGQSLTSLVVAADTTNHRGTFMAAAPSWGPTSTISATGAVIYKDTGTPSTSPLLLYIDFGGTKADSAGTFTINFDAVNKALYIG